MLHYYDCYFFLKDYYSPTIRRQQQKKKFKFCDSKLIYYAFYSTDHIGYNGFCVDKLIC